MTDAIKASVLDRIGHGDPWRSVGGPNYRFAASLVHVRYKTSAPFSFGVNPATLRAEWELWICGVPDLYYLLPITTVREMYDAPGAYVDARHPEIRVVSVDTDHHMATFARGGLSIDLRGYLRGKLPASAV